MGSVGRRFRIPEYVGWATAYIGKFGILLVKKIINRKKEVLLPEI